MRTVSFSQAKVQAELNNHFVCHMINTEGETGSGSSQAHAPTDKAGRCNEGVANQNVQLLFLTPKGEIFHTASGFRGPKTLEDELKFSRTLFTKIQKNPSDASKIVRTAHNERRVELARRPRQRRSRSGGWGRRRAQPNPVRLQLCSTLSDDDAAAV